MSDPSRPPPSRPDNGSGASTPSEPTPSPAPASRRASGSASYRLVVVLELLLLAGVLFAVLMRLHEGSNGLPETDPNATTAGTTSDEPEHDAVPPPFDSAGTEEPDPGPAAHEDVPDPPGAVDPATDDGISIPDVVEPAPPAPRPEPELRADAAAVLAALRVRLELIKTETGYYPASHGEADDAHRGIEALFTALPEEQRRRCPSADTDADGRPELLDPWSRPLVYWRADDYDRPQTVGDDIRISPHRLPEPASGYVSSHRFQLFSRGPDPVSSADDVVR